ncbi:Adenylate cyclase [Diplonema papillatum]|nr:Adenylate cyclase [Diplonema papillatum]
MQQLLQGPCSGSRWKAAAMAQISWATEKLASGVVLPGDDDITKLRKKIIIPLLFTSLIIGTFVLLTSVDSMRISWPTAVPMALLTSGSLAAFAYIVTYQSLTHTELQCVLAGFTLVVLLSDYFAAVMYAARIWPIVILVLDLCILCRMEAHVAFSHVCATVLWLTVSYTEDVFRFGLFDWVADEHLYAGTRAMYCCEKPPCGRPPAFAAHLCVTGASFLVLDYLTTRGFAVKMYDEKARVEAAIVTADSVAGSLAEFDLETAEEGLDAAADLPPKLRSAFRGIVANLKAYRPFLPDALFDELHINRAHSVAQVQTPGIMSGRACLVFTDIVGSTVAWEACPDGMKRGLKLHNKVIRQCIADFSGYEVKTVGDAFMVAFDSVTQAVNFGLAVQLKLFQTVWPASLLDVPHCARDATGAWCGLRVRIGMHYGDVDLELNSVSGRMDYFGNTVNKAARAEGICVEGCVAIPSEVLQMAAAGELMKMEKLSMGSVAMKGVQGECNVVLLLPSELSERRPFAERELQRRKEGANTKLPPIRSMPEHMRNSPATSEASTVINIKPYARDILRERLDAVTCSTITRVSIVVPPNTESYELHSVINDKLSKTLTSLDRSDGTVITVIGASVVAGWNTSKKCANHFENGLRFAGMLCGSLGADGETSRHVSVGLASGEVHCGNVGTSAQRFMTVIGPCVSLSRQLADGAAALGTFALYATRSAALLASLKNDLQFVGRPVDTWTVLGMSLTIFELAPAKLKTLLRSQLGRRDSPEAEASCGWSRPYWDAFETQDFVAVRELASDADHVAHCVALLLETKQHILCSPGVHLEDTLMLSSNTRGRVPPKH